MEEAKNTPVVQKPNLEERLNGKLSQKILETKLELPSQRRYHPQKEMTLSEYISRIDSEEYQLDDLLDIMDKNRERFQKECETKIRNFLLVLPTTYFKNINDPRVPEISKIPDNLDSRFKNLWKKLENFPNYKMKLNRFIEGATRIMRETESFIDGDTYKDVISDSVMMFSEKKLKPLLETLGYYRDLEDAKSHLQIILKSQNSNYVTPPLTIKQDRFADIKRYAKDSVSAILGAVLAIPSIVQSYRAKLAITKESSPVLEEASQEPERFAPLQTSETPDEITPWPYQEKDAICCIINTDFTPINFKPETQTAEVSTAPASSFSSSKIFSGLGERISRYKNGLGEKINRYQTQLTLGAIALSTALIVAYGANSDAARKQSVMNFERPAIAAAKSQPKESQHQFITQKPADPLPQSQDGKKTETKQYQVVKGDTLEGIAKKHLTQSFGHKPRLSEIKKFVEHIGKTNNITNLDKISIGQQISIPSAQEKLTEHAVKPGESFWTLGSGKPSRVDELLKLNGRHTLKEQAEAYKNPDYDPKKDPKNANNLKVGEKIRTYIITTSTSDDKTKTYHNDAAALAKDGVLPMLYALYQHSDNRRAVKKTGERLGQFYSMAIGGSTREDIAQRLGVTKDTVRRYEKRFEQITGNSIRMETRKTDGLERKLFAYIPQLEQYINVAA